MSGNYPSSNPFRRMGPPVENPSIDPSYTPTEPHTAPLTVNPTLPKKITKKVRVQSPPPLSPDSPSFEDRYPAYDVTASAFPGGRDPFDAMTSDTCEDEAAKKVPANPFSKTLQTMENPALAGSGSAAPPPNVSEAGRTSMDVEAFKRLLMTGDSGLGISTQSAASPAPAPAIPHPLATSGDSSTDTSSLSRQSIFEAIQEAHPESPRTSHEIEEPEEYRRGLAPSLTVSGRKKPPPPSSRHGKLIKVELRDDPVPSLQSPIPPTPSSGSSQQFSPPLSDLSRSQTDLNKPLPPAPRRESHDSDTESIFDREAAGKTPEPPSPSSSIRRKAPPPPARRHSHMVSDSKIKRSESLRLSTKVEEEEDTISEGNKENKVVTRSRSDSFKAAPPPPPSRRPGAAIQTISANAGLISPSSISIPPPPPATRGSSRSISGGSTGRPPSVRSLEFTSPGKRTSMFPPPPPPPPRLGKGNITAMDDKSPPPSRGVSGEFSRKSMESTRRDSLVVDIPEDQEKPDILGDLSRLQREIDELRMGGKTGT